MSHIPSAHLRRWRHAVATVLATTGLAIGVGLVPVHASPQPLAQASTSALSPSLEQRRGNPDAYSFFRHNGRIVHWNRCAAIGFRVYAKGAPRKGVADAREALRRINRAGGLKFRYRGKSRVKPNTSGTGYADGTDLVIGWMPRKRLGGSAGLGGWQSTGKGRITSGFVMINRSIKLRPGFGPGPASGFAGTTGQILMHEAGHSVGLQHVKDRAQIMYPTMRRRPATWGAGDFNGLRKLGRIRACR